MPQTVYRHAARRSYNIGGIMLIEVEILAMVVLGAIFYALAGREN
ncbi:MAG: hypothetical protein WBZ29_12055 [Methanocella sp.]